MGLVIWFVARRVRRRRFFLYKMQVGRRLAASYSYSYTDSIVDALVPEKFGHPVAVYPDPELANLAAARGWPVIGGGTILEQEKI